MSKGATRRETLERAARGLANRGVETSRLDAELLLAQALGCDRVGLYRDPEQLVPREGRIEFLRLLRARRSRVPVAYLLGRRGFYDLNLEVGPGVLIPRPETELLVEAAVERLGRGERPAWVLDLGTGSGNIALAVASQVTRARVVALEVSPRALHWCKLNLEACALGHRVQLVCADLGSASRLFPPGRFHLVISNPPYVDGRPGELDHELAYEPELALVGRDGPFPSIYRRIVAAAERLLAPDGSLLVEVGEGQAATVVRIFEAVGCFSGVRTLKDLASIERVVEGFGANKNQILR